MVGEASVEAYEGTIQLLIVRAGVVLWKLRNKKTKPKKKKTRVWVCV